MPGRARLAAALLILALPPGCATRGARFDVDKIPRIEEGKTTRADVEGWFGMPVTVKRRASGFSTYRYLHEDESVRDTGAFSRIGRFVASLFGYRTTTTPVNVRYANTVRHELIVLFNPDGVVTSYVYERTEIPSREIY